jgi:hypothetical protein
MSAIFVDLAGFVNPCGARVLPRNRGFSELKLVSFPDQGAGQKKDAPASAPR